MLDSFTASRQSFIWSNLKQGVKETNLFCRENGHKDNLNPCVCLQHVSLQRHKARLTCIAYKFWSIRRSLLGLAFQCFFPKSIWLFIHPPGRRRLSLHKTSPYVLLSHRQALWQRTTKFFVAFFKTVAAHVETKQAENQATNNKLIYVNKDIYISLYMIDSIYSTNRYIILLILMAIKTNPAQ